MNHRYHHRPADKAGKRWGLSDILGAVAGFFAFLFFIVISDLVQGYKTRDWPYTEATLVERRLTGTSASESSRNPGINYHFDYLFRYEWQGQTYFLHEQNVERMTGSDRKFSEFRNSPDAKRTVRLNPRNPAEATFKWGIAWDFDIAVGSLAIGCLVAAFLWRRWPAGGRKGDLEAHGPQASWFSK